MADRISDSEYRKIRWQSRRGMLELDLLLLPFVEQHFPHLNARQQGLYLQLLEQEDPELLAWFCRGGVPADPEMAALVVLICASQRL